MQWELLFVLRRICARFRLLTLLKHRRGLFRSGVGVHRPKIRTFLLLMNGDGVEEEGFAVHLHIEIRQFPYSVAHVLLANGKRPASIEMTEDASSEFDFAVQRAADPSKTVRLRIDP